MVSGPVPKFTIEELLRSAVEAVPKTEEGVFTTRELAGIFEVMTLDTARKYMSKLQDRGWRFLSTRKGIVNRAGASTSVPAYTVIPPSRDEEMDGDREDDGREQ